MTCWFCAKSAKGSCRFCGRGVCEDHDRFGPYILEIHHSDKRGRTEPLVVEDVLQCGTCRPRPHPVPLPELDWIGPVGEDALEARGTITDM